MHLRRPYAALASAPHRHRSRMGDQELRAGIIGTDTSHVPAFTKAFRDHPEWKIKVVAAYKGGSPDLPDQRQPRRQVSPRRFRASTASSSSTASTRSSPRSTSSCSRAWTGGRTWRRSRRCLRRASRCSSTSRSPRASRTRAGSRRCRSRRARRCSARSSARFQPDIPADAERSTRLARSTRVQANYQLNIIDVPSRPLLLRHSRRRGALCGDGAAAARG